MAYVLSSVSGNLISAASAGFAPTNSADVSAIASSYQVVSATATQLNAGTAYLTSVNETPISAARAGNAANASLANSAWYDGTGRMISSLPDEATVSSIASAYAESAASGKLDATAQVVTSTGSASAVMMGGTSYYASQINGLNISAQKADVADEWMHAGDKLDASASSSFYTTANESGYVDSAYVESQVSGKQDTLTFDYDNDKISAINGSALAGQGGGGGASIPFYGTYWDSAASATAVITADVSSVGSVAYKTYYGNYVNTYSGITDTLGNTHFGVASFISPGAEINGKNNGGIPYTLLFAPATSMWKTSDAATGIFAPLQYGTGAGMFLDNSTFKGYLKGNEWFVANTLYGYARGEVHQSRGCRVIVEHTGGAGAVLSARNSNANVTLNSTARGTAQMAVANSQAYVQVQRGNIDSKYNSAKLDTDYLKFYNGMTTGYLDPEDTASGTSYLPAETEYMYISSIPYWNGKLDASAIECDTASAITAIGGSSIAGGGASYTSPSGTIIVGADTLEGTDSGVGVTDLTSFQKSGYFGTTYGPSASGSSNYPTVFNLSGSAGTLSCRVSSNGAYYTSIFVDELNGTVVIPSGSWRLQKNHYAPMNWTAENYYSGTANVQLAHKSDVTVTSLKRTLIYNYITNPATTSTAVSAINGEPILAMSALSAGNSERALLTEDGKPLSAMVTATPYSKNRTIHITGLEIEGSDSAFMPSPYVESGAVTAVPFEWASSESATHWYYQWNTETSQKISRIDISGVNNYGSVFVRMGNFGGNEDLSTSFYVSPYVTDVYEIKTPFYVDYVFLNVSSQNSASSISSVTFTAYSQDSGTVVPLAHASALPTYGYDGTAITAIDGSAIGGGGGVDSATVSAIASSYAESAASGKLDTTAFNSGDFYTTSNPSGFITGVDLSDYATTAYVDSSVSGKQDASAMSDYQTTSAMTAYQLSGDYYSASNPSGFITGVDLSDYATTAYVDSSVSGKLDTTAYNSGDFYTTSNPSSFVDSAYVDSAVSGKADSSALSSYALSADVSGTVDLVSTQSANWGGSALALSAGPGVKLEKVGDTLVAGLDETVLYSGSNSGMVATPLTEPLSGFESFKICFNPFTANGMSKEWKEFSWAGSSDMYTVATFYRAQNDNLAWYVAFQPNADGTTITPVTNKLNSVGTSSVQDRTQIHVYKVVGINRTAEA